MGKIREPITFFTRQNANFNNLIYKTSKVKAKTLISEPPRNRLSHGQLPPPQQQSSLLPPPSTFQFRNTQKLHQQKITKLSQNYLCEIQNRNTHIVVNYYHGIKQVTKYEHFNNNNNNNNNKIVKPFLNTPPIVKNTDNGEGQTPHPKMEDDKIDTKLLTRKANLGTIIQMLQLKVPDMLTDLLPQEFVSDKVILKILPNHFPNLPIFKGYLMYSSTLKAIQKILLLFYLNPESKIHISNIKVIEPTNSMSSDELINLTLNNNVLESSTLSKQDTSQYTTKIKIKWRTCYSGCTHIHDTQTTDAKWGSYSIDHFDWTKLLKSPNPLQTLSLLEAKKTIEGLAKTLDPLAKIKENHHANSGNKSAVGRILTGVFVFELDAENEHIMVFTIDNMEILESKETDFINGCLA